MKKRILLTTAAVAILGGVAAVLFVWRPWRSPSPAVTQTIKIEGDVAAILDPSRLVTIAFVNRSGRPCKVTLDAGGANMRGSWTSAVPEGLRDTKFAISGPCDLHAVVIEHDGETVRRQLGVTLPPGTAHELRIGPDDTVEVLPVGK